MPQLNLICSKFSSLESSKGVPLFLPKAFLWKKESAEGMPMAPLGGEEYPTEGRGRWLERKPVFYSLTMTL